MAILIGSDQNNQQIHLNLKMANRHGLIAGATGTGKTISLQVLAENFSRAGVPVFAADVKGDLSGLAAIGKAHPKVDERVQKIKIDDFGFDAVPVCFWDLFGKKGAPIRTTIDEVGSQLLARILRLNDTQEGILNIAFRVSEDRSLPLLNLADLRALLNEISDNAKELRQQYGNIHKASVGTIVRNLLTLEDSGAENFFGEPGLDVHDLIKVDASGKGIVNILDATKLINDTRLYSTFLMWLMTELFDVLPEVGDPEKPKMVFFFDEAHLLFKDAPKILIEKIETVVRLIRSKGVGIFFVTQSPLDIPDSVLGQLGNRVQHALRAFSEKDLKAVKNVAKTFRQNPDIDSPKLLTELGIGKSLVSVLDENGMPGMVQHVLNSPPRSQMGPISEALRNQFIASSSMTSAYGKVVDRDSAFEMLKARKEKKPKEESIRKTPARRSNRQSAGEAFFKTFVRSIARRFATIIMKSLLGRR